MSDEAIRRARSVERTSDAAELYARWAQDYDRDVFEVAGVTGTARIADLLAEHLPDRSASVLDLGCGTGAAGARLAEHGFGVIDGADLSPEMLEFARRTGVYRSLVVADLTAPLIGAGRYDATIAAGVFTTGHLGAASMPALLALTRPGGWVAWVVADALWSEVGPRLGEWALGVVHLSHEPVRRDTPPEARFIVARTAGGGATPAR